MSEIDLHLDDLELKRFGQVIRPSHDGFAEATTIWNRRVARPQAVVRCRSPEDVREAVSTARAADLPISVRGGGHDWAGRAMCEGLVIDLTTMNTVEVLAQGTQARVGGGTRAIDLTRCLDPLGLAAVTGSVGAVGLGGLVLGGGYGPLTGRSGLASDNLLGAEVVLADGRLAVAGEREDPDLLWALRGGGGNFGVVTSMLLRVEPIATLHCGAVVYPLAEAPEILAMVAALCREAPDSMLVQLVFATAPDGEPAVMVLPYWSGDAGDGARQVAPYLALGTPMHIDVEARTFSEALSLYDGPLTEPHQVFMDTRWVADLSAEVAEVLIRQAARRPSAGCSIVTHEFRGAASRPAPEATAFGVRQPHILIEIVVQHDDPDGTADRAWASDTSEALAPLSLPGGYANLLPRHDPRTAASYGPNGKRLAELKRRYDPDDIFSSALGLPR